MPIVDLALKDLTQVVRDRKSAIFLLVMPVAFTLLFGLAFGGSGAGQDPRLPVGVIDLDGSRLSAGLIALLDASDAIRPVELRGAAAGVARVDRAVQDGDLAAAVTVPAGYGQQLLAGELPRLPVVDQAGGQAALVAESELGRAVLRLAGAAETARLSAAAYAAGGGPAGDSARGPILDAALDRALRAWQNPPLAVAATESGAVDRPRSPSAGSFSHTSPSMMVQFAIAGLLSAAEVLVLERKSRALRRLLTTAVSRVQILLGHWLAMFVMILVQLAILAAFGQVLGVDYARQPLAVALLVLATAFWTAGLGLLIGVLARTEGQAMLYSLLPMFVLAGMGGAWVPLEYTGKAFQAIGHLLPSAWAMDGFENIVVRGLGLGSVWPSLGVMLAYGVALLALAAWRFRAE